MQLGSTDLCSCSQANPICTNFVSSRTANRAPSGILSELAKLEPPKTFGLFDAPAPVNQKGGDVDEEEEIFAEAAG